MQHDTSPHPMELGGKKIKAQCTSLVFAYTRKLFIQYYPAFTRFEAKEDRDVVVYALWEKGEISNGEIARFFGISYSAVNHIVRDVKERIHKDPRLARKRKRINSQFKM